MASVNFKNINSLRAELINNNNQIYQLQRMLQAFVVLQAVDGMSQIIRMRIQQIKLRNNYIISILNQIDGLK